MNKLTMEYTWLRLQFLAQLSGVGVTGHSSASAATAVVVVPYSMSRGRDDPSCVQLLVQSGLRAPNDSWLALVMLPGGSRLVA